MPQRTFVAIAVTRQVMDSWQTWLLLRPLIVFAMACPLFVFAALLGLRQKPPEAEKWTQTSANQGPRFTLSASGVWRIQAGGSSRPLSSNYAASATQKCAA